MAHDSQVKNEESQSSNESGKPASGRKKNSQQGRSEQILEAQRRVEGQRECARVIGKWMARYGALPGDFSDDAVDNFYVTLAHCTEPEALDRAFIAAQGLAVSPEGRGFRPVPGEVVAAYRNEIANLPNRPRTHAQCEVCRGTGWKTVGPDGKQVPVGGWVYGQVAVHCDGKAAA